MDEQSLLFSFLLPLQDNSGLPIDEKTTRIIHLTLVEIAGGFSILPGLVSGAYRASNGTIIRDLNRLYSVAIERQRADQLRTFLHHDAKRLLSQESLYLEERWDMKAFLL